MKEKEKFMEKEDLEKRILKQKETAKKIIDDSESFILLTDEDMIGCASMLDTCQIMYSSLRTMIQEGMFPKRLLDDFYGFVKADDVNKYMEERIKELTKESEE